MSYRKYLMTDDVPPSELYKTVKIDTDSDTISRAKAIEALKQQAETMSEWSNRYAEQRKGILTAVNIVEDLPPAQPERIKGRWIPVGGALYQCDKCGVVSLKRKFCSECGAEMEVTT